VATYNLRNGIAFDGLDSWPLRRSATAATLAGLDVDVACLQEVYGFQQRFLLRRLVGYAAAGAGRTDGRRGERCAVLWRTARLRLDEARTRWFSDTPDLPGSTGWGNRQPRVATLARFTDRASGRAFGVADCHLEGWPPACRHRSARALLAWLDPDLPWVVAGDLNAEPGDEAVATLLDGGLRDVFAARPDDGAPPPVAAGARQGSGPAPGRLALGDCPPTTLPAHGRPGRRIDYLFVSDRWRVEAAAVAAADRRRRRPSDHLPVVATVRLAGDQARSGATHA
jgi:endonuclease/exonuclease/phosphatase family metal-dependent hydrolase